MAIRRGNNEGSIYHRIDGRWCAQVSLDGRRLTKYGKSPVGHSQISYSYGIFVFHPVCLLLTYLDNNNNSVYIVNIKTTNYNNFSPN
jgi:hypothetical protein